MLRRLRYALGLLLVVWGLPVLHRPAYAEASYIWRNVTVGGGGFSPRLVLSHLEAGLANLRTDIGGVYRWNRAARSWKPLQDSIAESNYFGVESVAASTSVPSGSTVRFSHSALNRGTERRQSAASVAKRAFRKCDTAARQRTRLP